MMPSTPELDWDDTTDRTNATRGLIDKLEPCVVRNAAGRVVWDNDRWDFLNKDECPDTVHPSLWRQSRLNTAQGLFEVAPGIYQVRGLDVSNMTIIEGETGVVVVDPLTSKEVAAEALGLYTRNRGERPVKAVIYTHSHGDHFGGVLGVTTHAAVETGACAVVAPDGFMDHAVSENVFAGPAMLRRAVYMYGRSLPVGPEASVGFGLGQALSTGTVGLIAPTQSITATGQELVLDGVRLVFQLTPDTEAPSEMNFYLPDHRVLLIAENVNHSLHNVLTLRGAQVRDAHAWASYITESIQLFEGAEILVGSHNWPTWGHDDVMRMLTQQRDAYAYLHDQTVRLMNQGLTGPEIAEEIHSFPGELGKAWSVRGYYGSLSHNVKAVYQRYMGWYDGNPAHLWQHPRSSRPRGTSPRSAERTPPSPPPARRSRPATCAGPPNCSTTFCSPNPSTPRHGNCRRRRTSGWASAKRTAPGATSTSREPRNCGRPVRRGAGPERPARTASTCSRRSPLDSSSSRWRSVWTDRGLPRTGCCCDGSSPTPTRCGRSWSATACSLRCGATRRAGKPHS